MQVSRYQIISISGSEKIIRSKNDIQKFKKRISENETNYNKIDFRKTFEHFFLTKIKFRNVELKILSTDVLKCEKESQRFFSSGALRARNKIEKLRLFSNFPNLFQN